MNPPFSLRAIVSIVGCSVLLSAEFIFFLAWFLSYFPIKASPLLTTLFARHQPLVVAEHDMGLYRFFCILVIFLTCIALCVAKHKAHERQTQFFFKSFVLIEGVTVLMVGWAYFKWLMYVGQSQWPNTFLGIMLGISLLSKIFFPELLRILNQLQRLANLVSRYKHKNIMAYGLIAILLISLISVRNIDSVLAKMFLTDHFHHLDTMIMSPAWAYLQGLILNVDTFTHYAVGLPIITATGVKLLGGFTYGHLLVWMIAITIIYYGIFFVFVRRWIGSIWLAGAAVLLLIKWNMFHPGVTPLIYNYPSATVLRYPLDIILLWVMYRQLMNPSWSKLALGSLICGFSLFYMIDSGVYMMLTWTMFVLFLGFEQWHSKKLSLVKAMPLVGALVLSIVTTLALLVLTQGGWVFSAIFWKNFAERTGLFLMGHGNILMTQSIQNAKFVEGIIGFIIPIIYIMTLLITSILIYMKQIERRWILLAFISIYGLASYHYYVCRSADTSYYVVCMPLVLILAVVMNIIMQRFYTQSRAIAITSFFVASLCLMTTHQMMNYPNWWHFSFSPIVKPQVPLFLENKISFMNHHQVLWNPQLKLEKNSLGETNEDLRIEKDFSDDKELRSYFNSEFDFTEDASLISSLVPENSSVALISSFETRILMQAKRKPFFYYFPLVDSRPMRMRMFDMTALWTTERLGKTLTKLKNEAPSYVFMEKILLAKSVPQAYEYLYPDLLVILNYLSTNYTPVQEGKYLVALKLNK